MGSDSSKEVIQATPVKPVVIHQNIIYTNNCTIIKPPNQARCSSFTDKQATVDDLFHTSPMRLMEQDEHRAHSSSQIIYVQGCSNMKPLENVKKDVPVNQLSAQHTSTVSKSSESAQFYKNVDCSLSEKDMPHSKLNVPHTSAVSKSSNSTQFQANVAENTGRSYKNVSSRNNMNPISKSNYPLKTDIRTSKSNVAGHQPVISNVAGASRNNVNPISKSNYPLKTDIRTSKSNVAGHQPVISNVAGASRNNVNPISKSNYPLKTDIRTSKSNVAGSNSNRNQNETESKLSKHEIFLKKIVSSFNLKYYQKSGRGYYCDLCDSFEIYYKKNDNRVFHDRSEQHKMKLQNVKPNSIKRYPCQWCNAQFYGDVKFWIDHINMVYHQKMQQNTEKKHTRDECASTAQSNSQVRSRNRNSSRNRRQHNKQEEKKHNVNLMPTLSLYEVISEQDSRTSNNSDSDSSEENNCHNENIIMSKRKPNYALIVADLPASASRNDVFTEFKDFGNIQNVEMNVNGPHTAKVVFKFRMSGNLGRESITEGTCMSRISAKNLVENDMPISIKGQYVKISLIEE